MKQKTTVLEEVKAQMKELQDKKHRDLETISNMQEEARNKIEAAALAMKHATEAMDVDAYEEAKTAKCKANTALEMYKGRYEQIAKQKLISEAESDQVIDSLLKYEENETEKFKALLSTHLKELDELLSGYKEIIRDTEFVIVTWNREIHANYRSRGRTTYVDELTGEPTDRSPRPIPVHPIEYGGCDESFMLSTFLDKVETLK